MTSVEDTNFPIDAVYLWVDGADPRWLAKKNEITEHGCGNQDACLQDDVNSEGRFADNGELRYSLRSLALFAPWIRNVYIVTDNQCPGWANLDRLKIVDHKAIFPSFASLPCYSTRAIELCAHRIKGLAENYLLFNDDFFLGSRIFPHDLFLHSGEPVLWVLKKRRRYKQKLLSDDYRHMNAHRGADIYGRRLILKRYQKYLPYKLRHYPKPMLRTVVEEIWNEIPAEIENTLSGHFRKTDDINISSFFSYYMMAVKKNRPRPINGLRSIFDFITGRVRHITATADGKTFAKRLEQIKMRQPLTFCINDTEIATQTDRKKISEFLSEMFPHKCIYER